MQRPSRPASPLRLLRPRNGAPIRFWMTGALAVVMAALASGRVQAREPGQMSSRASRFGVAQTAQLIEASARRQGLGVFARVKQPVVTLPGWSTSANNASALVLVFESSHGGTPVVMSGEGADLRSELPLRLEVFPRDNGASEVWIPAAVELAIEGDVPVGVVADLAGLPQLVADALG